MEDELQKISSNSEPPKINNHAVALIERKKNCEEGTYGQKSEALKSCLFRRISGNWIIR